MKVIYYKLEKHTINQGIAGAAIWYCSLCGVAISGMGGPRFDTICESCGDAIINGKEIMFEVKNV